MDRSIIVAVNENDEEIGLFDKMKVHRDGMLHRAVSVFIFNKEGKWLIQRRAEQKYHSASLWSNTACSHPVKGETTLESAEMRLTEEMGLKVSLEKLFSFHYKAEFENGLIENELDHVFIGHTEEAPIINPEEVSEYRWMTTFELEKEIEERPECFTVWFKILFPRMKQYIK